MIEFVYNNNSLSSIGMPSFKVLYVMRCRSRIGLFQIYEVSIKAQKLVHEAMNKVRLIREKLQKSSK